MGGVAAAQSLVDRLLAELPAGQIAFDDDASPPFLFDRLARFVGVALLGGERGDRGVGAIARERLDVTRGAFGMRDDVLPWQIVVDSSRPPRAAR